MTAAIQLQNEKTPPPAANAPQGQGHSAQDGTPRRPFQGAGAAYILVSAVLLGVGLGYLIDALRGTTPFWTVTCFFLFLVAGTYHMVREGGK